MPKLNAVEKARLRALANQNDLFAQSHEDHKAALENVRSGSEGATIFAKAASTADHGLSGLTAVDGVSLVADDIVLLKDQTAPAENGVYRAKSGTWVRVKDADNADVLQEGMEVFVGQGTVNADSEWTLTTNEPYTVGTTSLTFTLEPSAADLASTATGKGASLIGVEDASTYWTGTDAEAVLEEILTQIGGLTSTTFGFTEDNVLADDDDLYAALDKLDMKWGDLASTANTEGASLVGVEDPNGLFVSGADVEAALVELAQGAGDVNVETLAGDKTILLSPALTADSRFQMLDPDGTTRIVTLPAETARLGYWIQNTGTAAADVLTVNNDAAGLVVTVNAGETVLLVSSATAWSVVSHLVGKTTLGSAGTSLGASLVGVEDSGTYYTGTDVETVLTELSTQLGGLTSTTFTFAEGNVLTSDDVIYAALEKLDLKWGDLASTANAEGASLIGIEDSGTIITATDVEGALAENRTAIDALEVETAALGAENTDGQIQIPILMGTADAGTWTKAVTSGGLETVTRTNAAAQESFWVPVPVPTRSTASKGIKPTGLLVNYTVGTADANDIRFELWKVTQGADGVARTAAVLFGETDGDYDASHDTAAERGDDTANPELHLATVTDAGSPAYVGTGETLLLRVYVDDPGSSVVVLTSAILTFSETLVDLA